MLDWLNSRGWQLTDVSKQNLGYDLVGLAPDGDRAMIEVKRVLRPDDRFAMTNNEMGAMQATMEWAAGCPSWSQLMLNGIDSSSESS